MKTEDWVKEKTAYSDLHIQIDKVELSQALEKVCTDSPGLHKVSLYNVPVCICI